MEHIRANERTREALNSGLQHGLAGRTRAEMSAWSL
jgi:hypothetical protein